MISTLDTGKFVLYLITPNNNLGITDQFNEVDRLYRSVCTSGLLSDIIVYLRTKSNVIVEVTTPLERLMVSTTDITKVLNDIRTKICITYESILGVVVFRMDRLDHYTPIRYGDISNNGIYISVLYTYASECCRSHNGTSTESYCKSHRLKVAHGYLLTSIIDNGICYGYILDGYYLRYFYTQPPVCEIVVGMSKSGKYRSIDTNSRDITNGYRLYRYTFEGADDKYEYTNYIIPMLP